MRWLWRVGVGLLAVWGVMSVGLVGAVIVFGNQDGAGASDAILVLGSGVNADGSPPRTMVARAAHGAVLWQRGVAPVVLCAGGFTGGGAYSEASACRAALVAEGVPPEAVLLEARSINTEQNVAYSLEILTAQGAESVVVVSSRYHLLRARWLFWRARGDHALSVTTSPAPIGYLTPGEIVYAYAREWAAFHWQLVRDWFAVPHVRVPVP